MSATQLHLNKLRFLIIILLVIGIFFRFVNLEKKVYWPDETFTSLRISGYTEQEAVEKLYDGRVISIADLHKYQTLNSERNVTDTIKGLAIEEPQQAPLYYILVRFWVQLFGESVALTRSFSAGISLLVFPAIYWLCRELFDCTLTAWVAIALIAISPFHVLYAQEARPYAFWTVTILISSAALLRAMRLKTQFSWGLYIVTLVVSLYTFLLSGLVAISHGIYVLSMEKFRLTKTVIAYLLATVIAFFSFAPWLLVLKLNLSSAKATTDWASGRFSLFSLGEMWAGNFSRVFLDLGVGSDQPSSELFPLILPIILILLLIGYALYFVCCHTPQRTWLFILALIGGTGLILVLPDLILGGRRSGVARYLIPCYLGVELAVAHLLACRISNFRNNQPSKLWHLIAIALISAGVFSCTISTQAPVWWNKGPDRTRYNPLVAEIVNQAKQPLLINDNTDVALIQSLSYLLQPKVRFQLVIQPNIPKIPDGFSDIFLYRPSKTLQSGLIKNGYKVMPAYQGKQVWLWKATK